ADDKTPVIHDPIEAILTGRLIPVPSCPPASDSPRLVNQSSSTAGDPRGSSRCHFRVLPVFRGLRYFIVNEWPKAIYQFSELVGLQPDQEAVYNLRGWAYLEMGDFDHAIEDFSASLRLNPQAAPIFHYRGCIYGMKNDWTRAIADLSEAIRLTPT